MENKSHFSFIFKNSLIFLFFLFSIIFSLNLAYSNFYADIQIDVDSSGFVDIVGKTNYRGFINITNDESFIVKKGKIWTLNISSSKNEVFDNFIYDLILPENSQISYMKTTPNFRIANQGNRIKIIGIGENKPFTIIVQYKIQKQNLVSSFFSSYLIWFIIVFLLFFFGFLIFKSNLFLKITNQSSFFKNKHRNKLDNISNIDNNNNNNNNNNINTNLEKEIENVIKDTKLINPDHKINFKKYDLEEFSDRQREIILILEKEDKTQQELLEILKIPKSSISRNITSLEIKEIITIKKFGRYKKISLNKKKINDFD